MKRQILFIALLIAPFFVFSQAGFDLGLKAGINSSKLSANIQNYDSDAITRFHFGAFGRLGWGRIYIQPEAYFIKKGGSLSSGALTAATSFDYSAVEAPVLLGLKVINRERTNLRIMGGPVFSFKTSGDVKGDTRYTKEYFENRYLGYQYGAGIDFLFITLDVRVDNSFNNLYSSSTLDSKSKSYLITAGFKIF
jgi:hypothetical protein